MVKIRRILGPLLLLVVILTIVIVRQTRPIPLSTGEMKGMTEAAYQRNVLVGSSVLGQLPRMKRDGVNALSIQIGWYQNTDSSTHIFPDKSETPTDSSVSALIRAAHRDGMRVFLDPFINANQGNAWQAVFSPRSFPLWFASYDQYLAHYAKLAHKDHVQLFAIGDEFDSMDAIPSLKPDWIHAIQIVRKYYQGPITYCADYTHYSKVTFWHSLNAVGIDAYFSLSNSNTPSVKALETSWDRIGNQVEAFRRSEHLMGIPFYITELGYCSAWGAAINPGTWTPRLPVDLSIQKKLYEATFATIYRRPWMSGFFWFWWANASNPDWKGGPHDNGYTPRGKPAEQVLRNNFTSVGLRA